MLTEKLSEIFDEDEKLFWRLVNDEDELAINYGLDEVCDRYYAKSRAHTDSVDEDMDDYDTYAEVGEDLNSENGCDYSDDTEASDDESMDEVRSWPRFR